MAEVNQLNQMLDVADNASDASLQYLTFILGEEHYGVEILRVQEIKGWEKVTPIPKSPPHLCGVLNLRGVVVPIVDLRLFFDMPFREYSKTTVVVVLKVMHEMGQRIVGIVVDAVSDVQNVEPEQVRETPDFGSVVTTDYISGIFDNGEDMLMLLDVDKMLSPEQLG